MAIPAQFKTHVVSLDRQLQAAVENLEKVKRSADRAVARVAQAEKAVLAAEMQHKMFMDALDAAEAAKSKG